MSQAREIAEAIAMDIQLRRGLGDEWGSIDQDIRNEILGSWTSIIEKILESRIDGRPKFDPDRDENETCKCGHPYCRHFDTYDDMYPIGCKYCNCDVFETDTNGGIKSATEICSICHAKLNDDLKTCAKCGKEVEPWSPKT